VKTNCKFSDARVSSDYLSDGSYLGALKSVSFVLKFTM
jgi:hypothetical protein